MDMSTFDEILQLEYLVHWLFLPELCFTYHCHGIDSLNSAREIGCLGSELSYFMSIIVGRYDCFKYEGGQNIFEQ